MTKKRKQQLREELKEEIKKELTVQYVGNYDDSKIYDTLSRKDDVIIIPDKGEISFNEAFILPDSIIVKKITPRFNDDNTIEYLTSYMYPDKSACMIDEFDFNKYVSKNPVFKNAVFIKSHGGWRDIYLCVSKEADILSEIYANKSEFRLDGEKWEGSIIDKYIEVPESVLSEVQSKELKIHIFEEINRLADSVNKLNLITCEDFERYYKALSPFELNVIEPISGTNWITKTAYELFQNEIKEPHSLYHIKGTDKPPYFIINGHIVESDTDNWYEFVLNKFFNGVVQKWMLEEVTEKGGEKNE